MRRMMTTTMDWGGLMRMLRVQLVPVLVLVAMIRPSATLPSHLVMAHFAVTHWVTLIPTTCPSWWWRRCWPWCLRSLSKRTATAITATTAVTAVSSLRVSSYSYGCKWWIWCGTLRSSYAPPGGYYDPSPQTQQQQQNNNGPQRQFTHPNLTQSPAPSVTDPYAAVAAVTAASAANNRSAVLPNPYETANENAYGGYAGYDAQGPFSYGQQQQQQQQNGQAPRPRTTSVSPPPGTYDAPLTSAFGGGSSGVGERSHSNDHSGEAEDDNGSIAEDYGARRVLRVANE